MVPPQRCQEAVFCFCFEVDPVLPPSPPRLLPTLPPRPGGKRRLDLSFDPRKRLKTWEGARRLRDIKFREAQLQFLRSMRGKGAIVNLYGDAHVQGGVSGSEEEPSPRGLVLGDGGFAGAGGSLPRPPPPSG